MSEKTIHVLIIEDNDGDARLIKEMLDDSPVVRFHASCTPTLSKGQSLLEEGRIDVLLLDLGLPESQGLDTLRTALGWGYPIPVVIITGLNDESLGIQGVREGAEDYLIKDQTNSIILRQSICHAIMRVREKKALVESEARYRAMFSNMNDGVAVYTVIGDGKDFVFKDFNAAAERISCISREAVIGKRLLDLFPRTDRFGLFAALQRVYRTGISEHLPAANYKDQICQGWREIFIYKLPTREVVAIYKDVTDEKQTEEALIQINKKLNLMSSVTRHDILNQLAVLSGYLELLRQRLSDRKDLGYMTKVEKAVNTIERQISFTRIYQDIGVKAPEWQNVQKTIHKASDQLSLGTVTLDIQLDDVEIYADPLLEKVFYNIIDNSLRHGEKITMIRFYSHQHDGDFLIFCEDDGIGIRDDDKERIFEKGVGKQSGFGLFLAREILSITGLIIHETGKYRAGARFEIHVPDGRYRSSVDVNWR
jgi:PAS domain S-box-containing protein